MLPRILRCVSAYRKLPRTLVIAKMASPASPARGAAAAAVAPAAEAISVGNVSINGKDIPVTADAHLSADDAAKAVACVPFRDWVQGMDPALDIEGVRIQSIDMFGPRVGFMKFVATANFHGKRVPGIVFMRGGAVAVLVILVCKGQRWALCTRQPRVPAGMSAFLEIPAGMLDGSGNFSGVAAKELEEETGIKITDDKLIDMTELVYGPTSSLMPTGKRSEAAPAAAAAPVAPASAAAGGSGASAGSASSAAASAFESRAAGGITAGGHRGVYPSIGGCDEFLRLMHFSMDVDEAFLSDVRGKATGAIEEGEQITLDLVLLDDLWRCAPDGKTLAALLLYEKLRALGQLPA